MDDDGYFVALVRMFAQALTSVTVLPEPDRGVMLARLDAIRSAMRDVGWGVEDAMNELWIERVSAD